MKIIIAFACSFLFLASAHAGTLSLQLPVAHFNPICSYAPVNEQTVTGFSADGNYVYVEAHGYTTCGSSGRGSTVQHVYWCEQLTFDLSGSLVQETVLQPATSQGLNNCDKNNTWADPHLSFTEAAGYFAYTTSNWNYTQTVPWVKTP